MTLKQAVAAAFCYLEPRVRNYPKNEQAAMRAWLEDLERAGVTPEELERFVRDWAQRSDGFMPVPVDVVGPVYKARQSSDAGLVIHDPVKTGESMGVIEIGSRSRCLALGIDFEEIRPAAPSLESREEAKARLERVLALPVKKVPRERAEFCEEPDPEALARQTAMVADLRGAE